MLESESCLLTFKRELSAYQKGLEYEKAFAEVMRTHMGFRVQHRELRKGGFTARGYECDLVGTKGSGYFSALTIVGLIVGFVACNRYVNEYVSAQENRDLDYAVEQFVANHVPGLLPFTWVTLAIIATAAFYLSTRYGRLDVLVECRDRKEVVTRDDIHQLSGRVQDMREDKSAPSPDEVWMVASGGFDQDALTLATARGIHCILFRPNESAKPINGDLKSLVFRGHAICGINLANSR